MANIGPLMVDIEGLTLTAEDIDLIRSPQCGGLILFSRNVESADQILELTSAIRKVNPDIIIAVDQEGGRVQRFKKGFSKLPPLAELGKIFLKDPQLARDYALAFGKLMALEVQAVGCDISFAPVLDLGHVKSQVIGDRAFSIDATIIADLGEAYIEGMSLGGMLATGKHFPGHGSIVEDSHHDIPYDDRSLEVIRSDDMLPFKSLMPQLGAIMPAHIIYSQVDDKPAGFSSIWMQQILRSELNFDGVIFSDDLSMKGAEAVGDFSARANAALTAGCDMILVCNDRDAAAMLVSQFSNNTIDQVSAKRLAKLKMKQAPIGLQALKLQDSWLQLNDKLNQFYKSINIEEI